MVNTFRVKRLLYCSLARLTISLVPLLGRQSHPKSDVLSAPKWSDASVVAIDSWTSTFMSDICGTNIHLITLLIWYNKKRKCNSNG
jgi:hypothetical protein